MLNSVGTAVSIYVKIISLLSRKHRGLYWSPLCLVCHSCLFSVKLMAWQCFGCIYIQFALLMWCAIVFSLQQRFYMLTAFQEKPVAGRLQTIWFDWKHNKSHVGPGIQSHIITDKQPSHKPTSLIPKPFYFVVTVPPLANPSLPQSHPLPTPP